MDIIDLIRRFKLHIVYPTFDQTSIEVKQAFIKMFTDVLYENIEKDEVLNVEDFVISLYGEVGIKCEYGEGCYVIGDVSCLGDYLRHRVAYDKVGGDNDYTWKYKFLENRKDEGYGGKSYDGFLITCKIGKERQY